MRARVGGELLDGGGFDGGVRRRSPPAALEPDPDLAGALWLPAGDGLPAASSFPAESATALFSGAGGTFAVEPPFVAGVLPPGALPPAALPPSCSALGTYPDGEVLGPSYPAAALWPLSSFGSSPELALMMKGVARRTTPPIAAAATMGRDIRFGFPGAPTASASGAPSPEPPDAAAVAVAGRPARSQENRAVVATAGAAVVPTVVAAVAAGVGVGSGTVASSDDDGSDASVFASPSASASGGLGAPLPRSAEATPAAVSGSAVGSGPSPATAVAAVSASTSASASGSGFGFFPGFFSGAACDSSGSAPITPLLTDAVARAWLTFGAPASSGPVPPAPSGVPLCVSVTATGATPLLRHP